MRPVVLLDIDTTLLNSGRLLRSTVTHLIKNFNRADLQAIGYLLFGRPEGFLDSPAVEKSFLAPRYYREARFGDVVSTLKNLKGKADLGIFSQGPGRLQRAKLYLSGIEKYFDPKYVFILPIPKTSKINQVLARLPKTKIYFVDDRPDIAETLANHRVQVFLIRRGQRSYLQNSGIIRIRSLKEILAFI